MALTNQEKRELRDLVKEYKKYGFPKEEAVRIISWRFKKATVIKYWKAINGE